MSGIEPSALKILLNYMYTGDLNISCQNLTEIYSAAQKLKMKKVVVRCIQLLRKNDGASFVYKYTVSSKLNMIKEKHKSFCGILRNLKCCLMGREYLNLSIDQVCEIIAGGFLESEEYNVENYFLLFVVALKWISHNKLERMCHTMRLMCCMQFHKMTKKTMMQCFNLPLANDIMHLPGVKNMLKSALKQIPPNELNRSDEC